ncbi:DNA adenine methylase [Paenibacillus sp. 32352]|uniref:DNA adenine methylase n=1 Tax=Paenibacillus sp. 32352 TaxID=1969111 RepID=UPI0009AD9449|nr:DNA adenine methylase [Paenibacillus sp. 32352]
MPQRKGVRPPMKTLGGKSQLLDPLIEVLDYSVEEYDLTGICDLFLGGNRIHTHYEHPYIEFRLGNEIDRGVLALHRCLQDPDKVEDLLDQIQLIDDPNIINAEVFETFKQEIDTTIDEVAAAAMTYVVTEYSRAADRQTFCQENVNRGIKIDKVALKFYALEGVYEDVIYTNDDYEFSFDKYKHRDDYLFILDPPYVETDANGKTKETKAYKHKFNLERQEGLVDNLLKDDLKAKVILCGYPNDIYDRLTDSNGFYCYFIGMVHVASSSTGRKRPEFIWTNFPIPEYALPTAPFDIDEE